MENNKLKTILFGLLIITNFQIIEPNLIFGLENKSNINNKITNNSIKRKTSQGSETTLIIYDDLNNGDSWIETWGAKSIGNNTSTTISNKGEPGHLLNDGTTIDTPYDIKSNDILGRDYYENNDSIIDSLNDNDPTQFSFAPGEIFFKDESGYTLKRGEYHVIDAKYNSFSGMAAISYKDDGKGNYNNSGIETDHIFTWGLNDSSMLGQGNLSAFAPYPTLLGYNSTGIDDENQMIKYLSKGNDEWYLPENNALFAEDAEITAIYGDAFALIKNKNTDETKLFGWGSNNNNQLATITPNNDGNNQYATKPFESNDFNIDGIVDENQSNDFVSPLKENNILNIYPSSDGQFFLLESKDGLYKKSVYYFGRINPVGTWGQYAEGDKTTEPNKINVSGYLQDLVEENYWKDVNNSTIPPEINFREVINNPNTIIRDMASNGASVIYGIYDGLTKKEEIWFNGSTASGLSFEPEKPQKGIGVTDQSYGVQAHYENISSHFPILIQNDFESNSDRYQIKSINVTSDTMLKYNTYWGTNTPDPKKLDSAAVIIEDTENLNHEQIWTWGSQNEKGLLGNGDDLLTPNIIGDLSTESAANVTKYFPEYSETGYFVIQEIFISTTFMTAFVKEGNDKSKRIYNWGTNINGQFGIGDPKTTVSSSTVPYLNDRTPRIDFKIAPPSKNKIDLWFRYTIFSGIEFENKPILSGTGVPGGSIELDIPDDGTYGTLQYKKLPIDNLASNTKFEDWKITMSFKDKFSTLTKDTQNIVYNIPSFSTISDITTSNTKISSSNILGDNSFLIDTTINNPSNNPINKEMFDKTKIFADSKDLTTNEIQKNVELTINEIIGDTYSSINYIESIEEDTSVTPNIQKIIQSKRDSIIDGSRVQFNVTPNLTSNKYTNIEWTNFTFYFPDGLNGVEYTPQSGNDGTDPNKYDFNIIGDTTNIDSDFFAPISDSIINFISNKAIVILDSVGELDGTNVVLKPENLTKDSFDFKGYITNIDNNNDFKLKLNAKETNYEGIKDVIIDTKVLTSYVASTNSQEVTFQAINLDSDSKYEINSATFESNGIVSSKSYLINDTISTQSKSPEITNATWTNKIHNDINDESTYHTSTRTLNIHFENYDKQKINIKKVEILGNEIDLSKIKLISFNEIKPNSTSEYTYTDNEDYKTGDYQFIFEQQLTNKVIGNVIVTFDQTSLITSNLIENLKMIFDGGSIDKMPGVIDSKKPIEIVSSTKTTITYRIYAFNPDNSLINISVKMNDGNIYNSVASPEINESLTEIKGESTSQIFTITGLIPNTDYVIDEISIDSGKVDIDTSNTGIKTEKDSNNEFIIGGILIGIIGIILIIFGLFFIWYFLIYRKELKELRIKDNDFKNERKIKELRIKHPIKKLDKNVPNSNFLDFLIPIAEIIDPIFDKSKLEKKSKEEKNKK